MEDPFENMGAQLCKEVASKTNEIAGDGTTTATVLAQSIVNEGLKNVTAGANPIFLKRGIDLAVEKAVEEMKKMSTPVETKESIANVAAISGNDKEIGDCLLYTSVLRSLEWPLMPVWCHMAKRSSQ